MRLAARSGDVSKPQLRSLFGDTQRVEMYQYGNLLHTEAF
jgi:hypothetical protein